MIPDSGSGARAFKSLHTHYNGCARIIDNEYKRKSIHIVNGMWAFVLPFFPRIISIVIVAIALFFVFIMARPDSFFGSFFSHSFENMARKSDWDHGFLIGPTIYVVMIFLLVLFIDYRIAGSIFAILAFGDGFATVIGKKYGKHKFYNKKSLEGSIAFFAFSFISSITVFLLINQFNTPSAGLSFIPILILPKVLSVNIFNTLAGFIIIIFLLTLTELFAGDYIDDNLILPILGCILFYLIFVSFLAIRTPV